MTEYRHPRALEGIPGQPPGAVTLGGTNVAVSDGTFATEDARSVETLARAYDVPVSELRTDSGESEPTCGVNGCSREVDTPDETCWQHSD